MRSSLWAVGVVAVVGTSGCRQVAGITDDPPSGSITTACGLPFGTSVCASCASSSCCTESSACAADKTCSLYESCLGRCAGDPACRSRCAIDDPVGAASDVSALAACLASKCENDCDLRCGALAGWQVEPDAGPSCAACLAANACSTARACATSVECDAINRCILACPTLDCMDACMTSRGVTIDYGNPADAGGSAAPPEGGAAAWSALTKVTQGVCTTACATGGYWECVGKVSWPARSRLPRRFISGPRTTVRATLCRLLTCRSATHRTSTAQGPPQTEGPGLRGKSRSRSRTSTR